MDNNKYIKVADGYISWLRFYESNSIVMPIYKEAQKILKANNIDTGPALNRAKLSSGLFGQSVNIMMYYLPKPKIDTQPYISERVLQENAEEMAASIDKVNTLHNYFSEIISNVKNLNPEGSVIITVKPEYDAYKREVIEKTFTKKEILDIYISFVEKFLIDYKPIEYILGQKENNIFNQRKYFIISAETDIESGFIANNSELTTDFKKCLIVDNEGDVEYYQKIYKNVTAIEIEISFPNLSSVNTPNASIEKLKASVEKDALSMNIAKSSANQKFKI